jgi:hypothetical protein
MIWFFGTRINTEKISDNPFNPWHLWPKKSVC